MWGATQAYVGVFLSFMDISPLTLTLFYSAGLPFYLTS